MKTLNWQYSIALVFMVLMGSLHCTGQKTGLVNNEDFDIKISSLLDFSIPIISVKEAFSNKENVIFLDAREEEEYSVSHIKDAIHIGYNDPQLTAVNDFPTDTPLILYCSVGYRSEKIGKLLSEKGFSNVSNLYGSLFEWVNQGLPIVNKHGELTDTIHTYNTNWSKWVENPKSIKLH